MLDDLQWAAKPTLLLLRHVVRAGGGRVLVLCTYRDTELTHEHPLVELVADLRRQGAVERLSLTGLDDVGVAAFVEQVSGRTLDEATLALARAVYEETEGNPFFVREVLRHLAETGAVERQEGGWTTRLPVEQLGIPEGVRDVVGRPHHAELELRPDDGGDPKGVVGVAGQAGEPVADHLPDPFGNAQLVDGKPGHPAPLLPFDGPGLCQVAEHFPDEERVSLRLLVDGPGQGEGRLVERPARSLLDESPHAHVIEAAQGESLHIALAAKVGHDVHERMVMGQLGVPIDAEDEDSRTTGAHDVA
jgi:hypothetical protein